MPDLKNAINRLTALLTPAVGPTNETKIYQPLPEDRNAVLKMVLNQRASNAIRLGHSAIADSAVRNVRLLENELFLELGNLPDNDAEKRDYFELINATQAVLVAINESAA